MQNLKLVFRIACQANKGKKFTRKFVEQQATKAFIKKDEKPTGKSKLKLYYFSNVVVNRLLKIYNQKKQNQLKIIGDLNKQTYYKID